MWALILAFGMNFGWGNHPTHSNFHYWANYNQIYCEDLSPTAIPGDCQHRDVNDWIFFCDGFICDEHDITTIPEDCTILSIESGQCRYGVLVDR